MITRASLKAFLKIRLLAVVYVLACLVLYPWILHAVQEGPLSAFVVLWYLEPVKISILEEITAAFGFIAVFIVAYVWAFAKTRRAQFAACALVIAFASYCILAFVIADLLPTATYITRVFVMMFAIAMGISFAERLLYTMFRWNVFERPRVLYEAKEIAFILYIILPIAVYPAFRVVAELFLKAAGMDAGASFDSGHAFVLSYHYPFIALVFIACYAAGLFALFGKDNRVISFLFVTSMSLTLNLLALFLHARMGGHGVEIGTACEAANSYFCLPRIEEGWLLTLSIALSALANDRLFRLLGRKSLYERSSSNGGSRNA